MALATELVDRLKKELKSQGITYRDISQHLQLSESSIKRLFSEKDMSLSRLESICEMINLHISDLAQKTDDANRNLTELTVAQEELLVGDEELFLLAVHLIYGWTVQRILDNYSLDEHKVQINLTTLDKLKVIELLPENRVRILLSPDFEWIKGGPIQAFFEKSVQGDFFQSDFTGKGELRLVINGWIPISSAQAFHENMRRLAREFDSHKQSSKHSPPDERKGTTLVMAIRPWVLEIFEKYRVRT